MLKQAPTGARITPTGDIVYYRLNLIPRDGIIRGRNGVADLDYEQDEMDSSVFRLKYPECVYHTQFYKPTPCRQIKQLEWCSQLGVQINPVVCNNCKEIKKPQLE